MDSNKIGNAKLEVPVGIQLNDKDYITTFLSFLKDMEKNYVIAMTEASNESLYNKYKECFEKISQMQRKTYELMFRFGWYQLEKAPNDKIKEKLNVLFNEYQNLNLS